MTLQIIDPCQTTVINSDLSLTISDLEVQEGFLGAEQTIFSPKNSASVLYGNGYDRCGFTEFTILDPDSGNIIQVNNF